MGRGLLFLVGGMVILFGIIQTSVQERQKVVFDQTNLYFKEQNAKNISNGLAEYAIREIQKEQSWDGGGGYNNLLNGSGTLELYDQEDYQNNPGQLPENNSVGVWDEYTMLIFSEGDYNQLRSETEVLIRKDSFSKYSYFTDHEPSNIYFFSGDTLSGPVHTNGTFHIAGSPVFNGFVSSPNDWEGHTSYSNDPQFNEGTNFNAETRKPPETYNLELESQATAGGLRFNEPIQIDFKVEGNQGKVDISTQNGNSWSSPTEYDLSTFNGIISSSQEVYVEGTVKGQVSIHAEKDMHITGDLRYATNPAQDSTSTDLAGLIGEQNVIVSNDAHTDNGTKDVDIHASIMALNSSFEVEDYNSSGDRGDINLLGGIIQQQRGPVGTFSGGSIASGYSKSYTYDGRLLSMVPPSFPRESIFSINYWKERTIQNITP